MDAVAGNELNPSDLLYGRTQGKIDARLRISLTSAMRRTLGESFVLVKRWRGNLSVYPIKFFTSLVMQIESLPECSAKEELRRNFFSEVEYGVSCDLENRFVVPPNFRGPCGLQKDEEIEILGCGQYIEIWNRREFGLLQESGGKRGSEGVERYNKLVEEALASIRPRLTVVE